MKKIITVFIGFFAIALISIAILSGSGHVKAEMLSSDSNATCGQGGGCALTKEAYKGYDVGDQIPNLTLTSANGDTTSLYDLVKGHDKFILSFAADWCSDCHRQNEKLNDYYNSLEDNNYGAAVVFINYSNSDGSKTTNEQQMIDFINEQNYSFPTFYDKDSSFVNQYGSVYAVPFNFVLDENAIIKGKTMEIDADNLFLDNSETSRI